MISIQDADDKLTRQLLDWALPQAESIALETKRVSGKMVGKALETICASSPNLPTSMPAKGCA